VAGHRYAERLEDMEMGRIWLQACQSSRISLARMSPVDACLNDASCLSGYKLTEAPQAGGTLTLFLYWEVLEPTRGEYTVFTHLIGEGERIWGQEDGPPVDGAYPTREWHEREIIVDRYDLVLDSEAPPGGYRRAVGMYEPSTGARLPVDGKPENLLSQNRIHLTVVQVGQQDACSVDVLSTTCILPYTIPVPCTAFRTSVNSSIRSLSPPPRTIRRFDPEQWRIVWRPPPELPSDRLDPKLRIAVVVRPPRHVNTAWHRR
jgi:hypothetical protein